MHRLFRDVHFADPVISMGLTVVSAVTWVSRLSFIDALTGWKYAVALCGVSLLVFGVTLFVIQALRHYSGIGKDDLLQRRDEEIETLRRKIDTKMPPQFDAPAVRGQSEIQLQFDKLSKNYMQRSDECAAQKIEIDRLSKRLSEWQAVSASDASKNSELQKDLDLARAELLRASHDAPKSICAGPVVFDFTQLFDRRQVLIVFIHCFNGSRKEVRIGTSIAGAIHYNDTRLPSPELKLSVPIKPGEKSWLIIQQSMPELLAARIHGDMNASGGKFDFQGLKIGATLDGQENFILDLPHEITVRKTEGMVLTLLETRTREVAGASDRT